MIFENNIQLFLF